MFPTRGSGGLGRVFGHLSTITQSKGLDSHPCRIYSGSEVSPAPVLPAAPHPGPPLDRKRHNRPRCGAASDFAHGTEHQSEIWFYMEVVRQETLVRLLYRKIQYEPDAADECSLSCQRALWASDNNMLQLKDS